MDSRNLNTDDTEHGFTEVRDLFSPSTRNIADERVSGTISWQHGLANVTKVVLGVVGFGVITLYLGPAQTCADTAACGGWLVSFLQNQCGVSADTAHRATVGIFTAGGVDYALLNAYFSTKSIEKTVASFNNQSSALKKTLLAAGIMAFVATQVTQTFILSYVTARDPFSFSFSVIGAIPGALYAGANILPDLSSQITSRYHRISEQFRACVTNLSPTEIAMQNRLAHFAKEQSVLLDKLQAKLTTMVASAKNIRFDHEDNLLVQLMQLDGEPAKRTWAGTFSALTIKAIGMFAGLSHTIPGIINSQHFFAQYMPGYLAIMAALPLNISNTYNNLQVTTEGFETILHTLYDILFHQKIDSLAFQLRPKTSALFSLLYLTAPISYALVDTLMRGNCARDQDPFLEPVLCSAEFIEAADFNIAIPYHGQAVAHSVGLFVMLTCALAAQLKKDDREIQCYDAQEWVKQIGKMTPQQFMTYYDGLAAREQAALEVSAFQADEAASLLLTPDDTIEIFNLQNRADNLTTRREQNGGFTNTCLRFFSAANTVDASNNVALDLENDSTSDNETITVQDNYIRNCCGLM